MEHHKGEQAMLGRSIVEGKLPVVNQSTPGFISSKGFRHVLLVEVYGNLDEELLVSSSLPIGRSS